MREKYWFKNKRRGIGWTPASIEGWTVTIAYVVFCFVVAYLFEYRGLPEEAVLQSVLLPIFTGMFALIVIVLRTGEPLIWGWEGRTVHMRLENEPFSRIKAGTKKIEVRLYDKKRQGIKVGDAVQFSSRSNPQDRIDKNVVALEQFPSFAALYEKYPEEKTDIYRYYSREEESRYGVVAIILS